MKAYEVKMSVIGKSKNETNTIFVEANLISEIKKCQNVLKIWKRPDIDLNECSHYIINNTILIK